MDDTDDAFGEQQPRIGGVAVPVKISSRVDELIATQLTREKTLTGGASALLEEMRRYSSVPGGPSPTGSAGAGPAGGVAAWRARQVPPLSRMSTPGTSRSPSVSPRMRNVGEALEDAFSDISWSPRRQSYGILGSQPQQEQRLVPEPAAAVAALEAATEDRLRPPAPRQLRFEDEMDDELGPVDGGGADEHNSDADQLANALSEIDLRADPATDGEPSPARPAESTLGGRFKRFFREKSGKERWRGFGFGSRGASSTAARRPEEEQPLHTIGDNDDDHGHDDHDDDGDGNRDRDGGSGPAQPTVSVKLKRLFGGVTMPKLKLNTNGSQAGSESNLESLAASSPGRDGGVQPLSEIIGEDGGKGALEPGQPSPRGKFSFSFGFGGGGGAASSSGPSAADVDLDAILPLYPSDAQRTSFLGPPGEQSAIMEPLEPILDDDLALGDDTIRLAPTNSRGRSRRPDPWRQLCSALAEILSCSSCWGQGGYQRQLDDLDDEPV